MRIANPFSITILLFWINTRECFALLTHGTSNLSDTIHGLGGHTIDAAEMKQMVLNLTAEMEKLKRKTENDGSAIQILQQNFTILGEEKKMLQNRVFFLEAELNKLNASKTPSSDELMTYLRSTKQIVQTLAANEENDKNLTVRLNEAENNLAIYEKHNKNLTQQLNEVVNNLAASHVYENNLTQQLSDAVNTLDDLKVQMRYTSLSLLDVHSKTEELNTTLVRNVDDRIREIYDRITNITKKVAFTVGVTSYSTSWNSGTLVFDRIVYNIGGGYDPSTGVFTAPVDGHFVFCVNIQSYSSQTIYAYLVLNGSAKVTTMSYSGSTYPYQEGTNLVVLRLQKGDRVWVKFYSGRGYYTESSAPITTFSGFQI